MFQNLNKKTFIQTVWDYEKNPNHKRDDAVSCIVFFYINNDLCQKQHAVLENIVAGFLNQLSVFQVDITEEQILAADLGIRKAPALLFLIDAQAPQLAFGLFSEKKISGFLRRFYKG